MDELLNKRAIDATVGDIVNAVVSKITELGTNKQDERRVVYGVGELSKLLKCGRAKASRLSNSDSLSSAFIGQCGKTKMYDAGKVLKCFNHKKRG